MFLRTIRLCLQLVALTSVYAFIVLFPVYATGSAEDIEDFLDAISFTHVEDEDPRLWATFIGVYLTTGIAIVLLQRNFVAMLRLTTEYKSRNVIENRAICVMNVPTDMRSQDGLFNHYKQKFGCEPASISIAEDISTLETLLKKHRAVAKKLRVVRDQLRDDPSERPTHREYILCGKLNDSEVFYRDQLEVLSADILNEFKSRGQHVLAPVAFVTFQTIEDANLVAAHTGSSTDVLRSFDPSHGIVSFLAPEPRDILWENLAVTPEFRSARTLSSTLSFLVLLTFWLVPVAFISSLTNLDELGRRIPFLEAIVDSNSGLKAFLQGFLPTLGLTIFMAILPYILIYMHRIRAPVASSQLANLVFRRYFFSLVFMVFWVYTVTGTIFNQLESFLDASNILNTVGTSLPQQANFFVGYVTLGAFLSMSLELIRIGPLLMAVLFRSSSSGAKTSSDLEPMRYDLVLPQVLLFLVITLSYSMIAPVMLIFAICYFGFGYLVYKNQLLYVYGREWETGGVWWPQIFNRCIGALIMFQIVSMSVISLKGGFYQLGFLLPIIPLTFWFAYRTQNRFQRYFKTLDPVRAKQLSSIASSPVISAPDPHSPRGAAPDARVFTAPALRFDEVGGINAYLDKLGHEERSSQPYTSPVASSKHLELEQSSSGRNSPAPAEVSAAKSAEPSGPEIVVDSEQKSDS